MKRRFFITLYANSRLNHETLGTHPARKVRVAGYQIFAKAAKRIAFPYLQRIRFVDVAEYATFWIESVDGHIHVNAGSD